MSLPYFLSYAALWILVVLQSLILLGVVHIVYQIQHTDVADNGLPVGREAPQFNTIDLTGTPIRSADFAGRLTALLFVSPSCSLCTATLDEIEALHYKAKGNVIVICRAGRDDCARLAERHQLNVPIVADEDERISRLFDIVGVPMAVLVNESNRIQSYGHPMRGEELEAMFEEPPTAEVRVVR